jgi:anti-sigma B factor antagonist
MRQTFRITAVPGDEDCTLVLTGEIDLATAPDLIELGTVSLTEPGSRSLIIDLNAVTFVDSTAIGALITLRNTAVAANKHLVLRSIPERVHKVLTIAGLERVFETAD